MKWLPNALTILRCILAFVVGWAILEMSFVYSNMFAAETIDERQSIEMATMSDLRFWTVAAPFVFVFAALLDFLDGWLARRWEVESDFGRLLDPIGDKLLVGIPLLLIGIMATKTPLTTAAITPPAFAIVIRDVSVTALRFSTRGGSATVVSSLAKWKTTFEFLAIAIPLIAIAWTFNHDADFFALNLNSWPFFVGTGLLWLAAALSLYTGYQYVRAAFSKKPE